ncbi:hypothetical protein E2C01_094647 [Portunus trituberculatus]|uniref:Uncharacterized protein n=1 Tax=Portunus trituberculatus TaxID=210409 RepID=A0A5B7JXF4_PORTR|nr:hypothetical protein [Portunus trituberculatus]
MPIPASCPVFEPPTLSQRRGYIGRLVCPTSPIPTAPPPTLIASCVLGASRIVSSRLIFNAVLHHCLKSRRQGGSERWESSTPGK